LQDNIIGAGARLILLLSMMLLSACALPRPGPNAEEIVASSKRAGGNLNVVLVDQQIARRAYVSPDLGFSTEFLTLPGTRTDIINPGDALSITVWENVDNGLLVGAGQKVAGLEHIQVDQRGEIFMPYAGRVDAAGLTPEELRGVITDRLGSQTPDPQVEVRRQAGDGATVNIIGGWRGRASIRSNRRPTGWRRCWRPRAASPSTQRSPSSPCAGAGAAVRSICRTCSTIPRSTSRCVPVTT